MPRVHPVAHRHRHTTDPHPTGGAGPPLRHRPGEAGTGTIGTAAGATAFLVFLLFAVQLLVNLYATSMVTAAGYDSARVVASRHVDHSDPVSVARARSTAEARFHHLMGRAGGDADLDWTVTSSHVRLRVVVDTPSILPSVFGPVALGRVERTFVVHTETMR